MRKAIVKFLSFFILSSKKRKAFRKRYSNNFIKYCLFKGKYKIKGNNNKIIIVENGIERELCKYERIKGLDISINGNNNLVKIEIPIIGVGSNIEIGNDNVIIDIGSSYYFNRLFIRCCFGLGQYCKIGKNTTICEANIILDGKSGCIIGEDCMFSSSIRIWGDDGHSILGIEGRNILNKPQGHITIGDHVWIGEGARITKNARIGKHCIIGGGAVAYKDYGEDNCIIAGNPGNIVRRNVTWDRRNTYNLEETIVKERDIENVKSA
ncbi:MAG: acyltransferase [Alphaproteobacteria bacterium]|nr:acyltransferase [Alphaproteobacteria bacterium]